MGALEDCQLCSLAWKKKELNNHERQQRKRQGRESNNFIPYSWEGPRAGSLLNGLGYFTGPQGPCWSCLDTILLPHHHPPSGSTPHTRPHVFSAFPSVSCENMRLPPHGARCHFPYYVHPTLLHYSHLLETDTDCCWGRANGYSSCFLLTRGGV